MPDTITAPYQPWMIAPADIETYPHMQLRLGRDLVLGAFYAAAGEATWYALAFDLDGEYIGTVAKADRCMPRSLDHLWSNAVAVAPRLYPERV